MQKGRRETFAEKLGSWDLINGRPLEGSSVTGKGHTHTGPPICNLFTDSEQRQRSKASAERAGRERVSGEVVFGSLFTGNSSPAANAAKQTDAANYLRFCHKEVSKLL